MPPGEKERQNHTRLKQSATGWRHKNSKHPGILNMPLGNTSKRKHPEETEVECTWRCHATDDINVSSRNGNYFSSVQPVNEEVLPAFQNLRQDVSLSLDSLNENLIDLTSNYRHRSADSLLHCPFASHKSETKPVISITDLRSNSIERSSSRESLSDCSNFDDYDYDDKIPLITDSESDEEDDNFHVSLIKLHDSSCIHPSVSSPSDIPFRKVTPSSVAATISACNSYDSFPTTSSCESLRTVSSSSASSSVSDFFPNPESYEMLYRNFELAARMESEKNLYGSPPFFQMDIKCGNSSSSTSWHSTVRRKSTKLSDKGSLSSNDVESESDNGITTFARLADKKSKQTTFEDSNSETSENNTHWSEVLSKQKFNSPKEEADNGSPGSTSSLNSEGTKPKRPQFLPIQLRHIQRPSTRPSKTPLLQDVQGEIPLTSAHGLLRTLSAPVGMVSGPTKGTLGIHNSASILPEILQNTIPEMRDNANVLPDYRNTSRIFKAENTVCREIKSAEDANKMEDKDWEDLLGNRKWTSWNNTASSTFKRPVLKPLKFLKDINANYSSDGGQLKLCHSNKPSFHNLDTEDGMRKLHDSKPSPSNIAKWLEEEALSKATSSSSNVLEDNELDRIPNHIIPRLPSDEFSDTCSLSSLESLEMDDSVIWESLYSFPSDDSFLSAPYPKPEVDDEFEDSLVENIDHRNDLDVNNETPTNCKNKGVHANLPRSPPRPTELKISPKPSIKQTVSQNTFQYPAKLANSSTESHLSPFLMDLKAPVSSASSTVQFLGNCKWSNSNTNNSCDNDKALSLSKTHPHFPIYKLTTLSDFSAHSNGFYAENGGNNVRVKYAKHKPLKPIHIVDAEYRCRKAIEQLKKSQQPSTGIPSKVPAEGIQPADAERPKTLQLRRKDEGDSQAMDDACGWEEDIMDALPPQEMNVSPRDDEQEKIGQLVKEKKVLVNAVDSAVNVILKHFEGANSKDPQEKFKLGDSKLTPEIGHLVLHYVCPAIEAVFSDSLKPYTHSWLVGRVKNSVWTVIDATTELGPGTRCLNELVTAIKAQHYLRGNSLKINAFFMGLLNNNLFEVWLQHIQDHPNIIQKYYETTAFIYLCNTEPFQGIFSELIVALQPLTLLPFRLDYAFEYRLLQIESNKSPDLTMSYPNNSSVSIESSGPMSILIGQKKEQMTASIEDPKSLSNSLWNFVGKVKSYKSSWNSGQSVEQVQVKSAAESRISQVYEGNIPSPAIKEIHPLARRDGFLGQSEFWSDASEANQEEEIDTSVSGSQGWTMKWIKDFASTVPLPETEPDGKSSSGEEEGYSFRARERLSSVFRSQRWQRLGTGISQMLPKVSRQDSSNQDNNREWKPPTYDRHLSGSSDKDFNAEESRTSQETDSSLLGSPVKTLCNHVTSEEGELSFSKGDILTIQHQVDSDWFHCSYGKDAGRVHKDHVQQIK